MISLLKRPLYFLLSFSAAEAVMKGQTDSILLFHQQNVPHSKLEQVRHLLFLRVKPHRSSTLKATGANQVGMFGYFNLGYLAVPVSVVASEILRVVQQLHSTTGYTQRLLGPSAGG